MKRAKIRTRIRGTRSVIYDVVRRYGEEEMERPAVWSSSWTCAARERCCALPPLAGLLWLALLFGFGWSDFGTRSISPAAWSR